MTLYHTNPSKRKKTGGARTPWRRKREYEMGRGPTETKISGDKDVVQGIRVIGGNVKLRVKMTGHINVSSKDGKTTRAKILELTENPSNSLYARRGIATKGALVRTTAGLVRVTSKPGKDGTLNGTLVEEAEAS